MTYRALDYEFSISASGPMAAEIDRALRPLEVVDESADGDRLAISQTAEGAWSMTNGETPADVHAVSSGRMLARVLEFVNQQAAHLIDDGAPLHGATVVDREGRAVALVGRSGAGKSTLAAAAVRAGWQLVAEEISVAQPKSLMVRPYHRPIGLRRGGAELIGVDYPESAAGLFSDVYPWPVDRAACSGTRRLVAIALIDRSAEDPAPEILRPAVALSQLIEHMVVPDDLKIVPAFRSLETVIRNVPTWHLPYRGIADGLRRLEEIVSVRAPKA